MATPKILIADDNAQNRELLEALLAKFDCETEFSVDGQDTLDKVQAFQPDLILLDVMMPKLNGFEVCRKLKSDRATSKIMILMVTALSELGDIERAVEAGTDDFLSKPLTRWSCRSEFITCSNSREPKTSWRGYVPIFVPWKRPSSRRIVAIGISD